MAISVAFETYDVAPSPVELSRFHTLPEEERMRVIIRVLCGLVAIEDEPEELAPVVPLPRPAPSSLTPAPVASPPEGATDSSAPSRFRLPFLGLEMGGARKLAAMGGDR
jgi:hypothetical protein